MRCSKPALIALLVLFASCSRDGTGAGGPSWFRASVSGEVSSEYEGTGDFGFYREEDGGPGRYFKIGSQGTRAELDENFYLRWPDDRRPRPGTYALVPHTMLHGSPHGVTAIYTWHKGDNVTAPSHHELYVASGGVVEITRSTADEVEGTIRFSGVQVGKWVGITTERHDLPYAPKADAPTIDVSGSFRVTRFDIDDWEVRTN